MLSRRVSRGSSVSPGPRPFVYVCNARRYAVELENVSAEDSDTYKQRRGTSGAGRPWRKTRAINDVATISWSGGG